MWIEWWNSGCCSGFKKRTVPIFLKENDNFPFGKIQSEKYLHKNTMLEKCLMSSLCVPKLDEKKVTMIVALVFFKILQFDVN